MPAAAPICSYDVYTMRMKWQEKASQRPHACRRTPSLAAWRGGARFGRRAGVVRGAAEKPTHPTQPTLIRCLLCALCLPAPPFDVPAPAGSQDGVEVLPQSGGGRAARHLPVRVSFGVWEGVHWHECAPQGRAQGAGTEALVRTAAATAAPAATRGSCRPPRPCDAQHPLLPADPCCRYIGTGAATTFSILLITG